VVCLERQSSIVVLCIQYVEFEKALESKGITMAIRIRYFSETTLRHLKPKQGLSVRHRKRAIDVTLAAKLAHAYGKYHLAMLHRELFISEKKTSYQQAERMAAMMNQLTIIHSSPSDFLHTKEESVDECIDTYKEFKQLVGEYVDEYFVPSVALLSLLSQF